MTPPERGRDGLREAIEALAVGALVEWAGESPDLDDCREAAALIAQRLVDAGVRFVLAEHPATGDEERCECGSCGESPENECPKSRRPCGHHCNHVWTHDACDWCGKGFGGDVPEDAEPTCACADPVTWVLDPSVRVHTPPASDVDSDNAAAGGAEGLDAWFRGYDEAGNWQAYCAISVLVSDLLASGWLAAHVAQAKAEALREAADALDERWYQKEAAMPDSHETSCWLDGHESAEEFIRDRADRIEGTR